MKIEVRINGARSAFALALRLFNFVFAGGIWSLGQPQEVVKALRHAERLSRGRTGLF